MGLTRPTFFDEARRDLTDRYADEARDATVEEIPLLTTFSKHLDKTISEPDASRGFINRAVVTDRPLTNGVTKKVSKKGDKSSRPPTGTRSDQQPVLADKRGSVVDSVLDSE